MYCAQHTFEFSKLSMSALGRLLRIDFVLLMYVNEYCSLVHILYIAKLTFTLTHVPIDLLDYVRVIEYEYEYEYEYEQLEYLRMFDELMFM